MKHLKRLTLLSFVLLLAGRGFGQKVKLEEGDLSPLKSEKTLAFAFTYDSMSMVVVDMDIHPDLDMHMDNRQRRNTLQNTRKIIIKNHLGKAMSGPRPGKMTGKLYTNPALLRNLKNMADFSLTQNRNILLYSKPLILNQDLMLASCVIMPKSVVLPGLLKLPINLM